MGEMWKPLGVPGAPGPSPLGPPPAPRPQSHLFLSPLGCFQQLRLEVRAGAPEPSYPYLPLSRVGRIPLRPALRSLGTGG